MYSIWILHLLRVLNCGNILQKLIPGKTVQLKMKSGTSQSFISKKINLFWPLERKLQEREIYANKLTSMYKALLWALCYLLLQNIFACKGKRIEVTDGRMVRAGISVTWKVLSWSIIHEFEPQSGELGVHSTFVLSHTWPNIANTREL